MTEKHRQHRDFLQNIIITVLTVSAALLFIQTQIDALGSSSSLRHLFLGSDQPGSTTSVQEATLSAPIRGVVSGPYGRYACVCDLTEDETLRTLLREVLGSTGTFAVCQQQDFLHALEDTSVYFDFLAPMPLSILADMAGTDAPDSPTARRLVISGSGDEVSLFLWDGSTSYLRCSTAVSLKNLEQIVSSYELGNGAFAMDLSSTDPHAAALEPCSLFFYETPEIPSLSVQTPEYDKTVLLTGLGFNPNTKNSYTDNGTEVISEEGRSLRLRADGTVTYQSGGDSTLTISAVEDVPTLQESAAGAGSILRQLLVPAAGSELLCLTGIRRSGSTTVLTFGYQVNGIPVFFADGGDAATVTLNGAAVASLSLRIRRYTPLDSNSLLLPLPQALSIASRFSGGELSIGYADHGGTAVDAQWMID